MAIRQRTGLCWDSDLEWLVMLVGCRFFRINVISFGAGLGDVVRSRCTLYIIHPRRLKNTIEKKTQKHHFFHRRYIFKRLFVCIVMIMLLIGHGWTVMDFPEDIRFFGTSCSWLFVVVGWKPVILGCFFQVLLGIRVGWSYLVLGGGNSNMFYFHPYLGRWSNLTNMYMFQMGWNHQLVV